MVCRKGQVVCCKSRRRTHEHILVLNTVVDRELHLQEGFARLSHLTAAGCDCIWDHRCAEISESSGVTSTRRRSRCTRACNSPPNRHCMSVSWFTVSVLPVGAHRAKTSRVRIQAADERHATEHWNQPQNSPTAQPTFDCAGKCPNVLLVNPRDERRLVIRKT